MLESNRHESVTFRHYPCRCGVFFRPGHGELCQWRGGSKCSNHQHHDRSRRRGSRIPGATLRWPGRDGKSRFVDHQWRQRDVGSFFHRRRGWVFLWRRSDYCRCFRRDNRYHAGSCLDDILGCQLGNSHLLSWRVQSYSSKSWGSQSDAEHGGPARIYRGSPYPMSACPGTIVDCVDHAGDARARTFWSAPPRSA